MDARVLRRTAVAALLVLVVGVVALTTRGDSATEPDAGARAGTTATRPLPPARSARTLRELNPKRVIARVEALRGLKLERPPRFRVLTPEQAGRRVADAEERESGGGGDSARDERINLSLVTLLGLLPPDVDLDDLGTRITTQGTLGFYDGKRNEMAIISRTNRLPVGVETTLAHELTHAIDDQHFDVFDRVQRRVRGDDADAELAYRSVVEGNASEVEERYREKYRIPQPDDGGDAEQRRLARDLPFGLQLQLGFPYVVGEVFVDALQKQRGGQALLERALKTSPPRSTVEILDPVRWLRPEPVIPTPLRPGPVLGRGWTPLDDDTIDAADVLGLLAPVEDEAGAAALVARTWRGGAYRYLRRGGAAARGCEDPCVTRDAVVASVAFAAEPDARAFATQFGRVLVDHRKAKEAGAAVWRVGGGGAAVGIVGTTATFAYAPTPELAIRLVGEAPRA